MGLMPSCFYLDAIRHLQTARYRTVNAAASMATTCLILSAISGCAPPPQVKQPAPEVQQPALSEPVELACQRKRKGSRQLDDGKSDAKIVALAVRGACRSLYLKAIAPL